MGNSATKAFAKAAITMARIDLWRARLALKTLRRVQREAIAEVAESSGSCYPGCYPGREKSLED